MNPVLLAFALGMCVVVVAQLAVEYRRNKVVGDGGRTGYFPLPVPAPDRPAPTLPVVGAGTIDAGGTPTAAASVIVSGDARGCGSGVRGCGTDGCSSATHTPICTETIDLGHGVMKVTNWWCNPPAIRYYHLTDWTVSFAENVITYDVREWVYDSPVNA